MRNKRNSCAYFESEEMTEFLQWTTDNPSALASLISAIIAASVALLLFTLGQFLTRKQQRVQFLTPKLEELYLLLNEISEHNVKFFRLSYLCLEGDTEARRQLNEEDDLEIYGHRTAKRIIMYIRLYFPKLASIHQRLFAAQRELNGLMFLMPTANPPEISDVMAASGMIGHFIRLMEQEIIRNRDHLLSDHIFPKRYLRTTPEQLEAVVPLPEGPIMRPNFPHPGSEQPNPV